MSVRTSSANVRPAPDLDSQAGQSMVEVETSVIARAFVLLACFIRDSEELALADLVKRTGLPKGTVHRLAAQLMAVGALERSGKRYRLGLCLFELSGAVWAQRVLRDLAMPYMQDLYSVTKETIQLAWFDAEEVLYIDRVRGHDGIVLPTFPGGRMPAYCTALGKAMLAFSSPDSFRAVVSRGLTPLSRRTVTAPGMLVSQLRNIRKTKLAYDMEEAVPGVACVAAPILDEAGAAIAAISVSMTTPRLRRLRLDTVAHAADGIGKAVRARRRSAFPVTPQHYAGWTRLSGR
ncbi:MAG: helix-turn-helix domain-containing protein [Micromonosporaceae bacterium]|nr:helix-turn-helix domain-containing protein [Micromonosporaceae bacterium]